MNVHRYFSLAATVAALSFAAPASAQSTACYKGQCVGLNTNALGSNFAPIDTGIVSRWPAVVGGISGGNVDASYLDATATGACVGFATSLPDHIVTVDQDSLLSFEVSSGRDTALLIHGPGGWRCNDDTNGQDPFVSDLWAAGEYRVWVSSYSRGFYDYELRVEHIAQAPPTNSGGRGGRGDHGHGTGPGSGHGNPTTPPPSGRRGRGLDASSTVSEYGDILFRPGDRTAVLTGTTGGQTSFSPLRGVDGESCVGYADRDPDHIITLTDTFQLQLSATAGQDSTLAIHGPQGWHCNDDYDGFHPTVSGTFAPGTYRVWVGAFEYRGDAAYRLTVTDLSAPVVLPPPVPLTFSFQGRFEDMDVVFTGETVHDVFQECRAFASTSESLGWVDDITVGGRSFHNGPSYWEGDALCGIAALNAVSSRRTPILVSGTIEDMVPFSIHAGPHDARELLSIYIPRVVDSGWVDDIVVNGRASHNGPSYWSASEIVAIISAGVAEPGATLFASGTIEDNAFSFSGRSVNDVQEQCLTFIGQAMAGTWIDDVSVNGTDRHNASGWWSPSDVCMIVGSLATDRRQ